jgi:hypothetical protein
MYDKVKLRTTDQSGKLDCTILKSIVKLTLFCQWATYFGLWLWDSGSYNMYNSNRRGNTS